MRAADHEREEVNTLTDKQDKKYEAPSIRDLGLITDMTRGNPGGKNPSDTGMGKNS